MDKCDGEMFFELKKIRGAALTIVTRNDDIRYMLNRRESNAGRKKSITCRNAGTPDQMRKGRMNRA